MDVGILLSKDEDDDGRYGEAAYWVVSVDGSSEEEVIPEKSLGRILDPNVQSDESTVDKSAAARPIKKATTKAKIKSRSTIKGNRRINTRAAGKNGEATELLLGLESERKPSPRPKKRETDETVIEVKMRTGTLFIYRGEHHRVEFVHTV